jgi:acyl-CoA thioesterase-1
MNLRSVSCQFTAISLILTACFIIGCGGSDSSDIKYVAIGASDATGVGAIPFTKGYVFIIDQELEDQTNKEVGLTNLGIPGGKVDEMVELELPLAKEIDPDLVTVWAGPNDLTQGESVEDFRDNLDELLSGLSENPSTYIAIALIPDLTQLPKYQSDPDSDVTLSRIASFNNVITDLAAAHGAHLVDLSIATSSSEFVSADGFHPSNKGHAVIAQQFLNVIIPAFSNTAE